MVFRLRLRIIGCRETADFLFTLFSFITSDYNFDENIVICVIFILNHSY